MDASCGIEQRVSAKTQSVFLPLSQHRFSYRSLCCLSRIVDGGRAAGYVWVEYTEDTERKRDG